MMLQLAVNEVFVMDEAVDATGPAGKAMIEIVFELIEVPEAFTALTLY